jgi:hypothetical protein
MSNPKRNLELQGGTSVWLHAWVDRYEKSHQNPLNRVFHTFGIPMIAVSIPLFLIAPLVRGFWKIPSRFADQSPAT